MLEDRWTTYGLEAFKRGKRETKRVNAQLLRNGRLDSVEEEREEQRSLSLSLCLPCLYGVEANELENGVGERGPLWRMVRVTE